MVNVNKWVVLTAILPASTNSHTLPERTTLQEQRSRAIIAVTYFSRLKNKMSEDMIGGFERKQIVATHEAGHAVICYVLGYDFELITIEQNETLGSDGAFQRSPLKEAREYSSLTEDGKKHWMLDKITMIMSGGLAVYHLTNNEKALGMDPDLNSAWDLARMLVKDEEKVTELNTVLASRVGDLIRNKRNWAAITALAKALIKSKTLNYEEAVKVIEHAFNDFDQSKA